MAGDGSDPELEIHIRTDADSAGLDQVGKSLEDVGTHSTNVTHSLRELTGTSRHTGEIIRAIGAASEGSARGIGEMVRGLRSLIIVGGEAAGASGLGAIALAAGALLGVFAALSRHAHSAAEDIKDTGKQSEDAAKKMEAIKKAVDEDFKPLDDILKQIDAHFADLNKRMSESESAANKLASAQKELTISEIDLNKAKDISNAKSPEEISYIEKKAEAAKEEVEAKSKQVAAAQELRDAQVKQAAAEDEANQKAGLAAQANQKVADAQKTLNDAIVTGKRAVQFAAEDETKAAAGVGVDNLAGPTSDIAGKEAKATAGARADRAAAVQAVAEARAKVKESQEKAGPIQDAADKAQSQLERAQIDVSNKQVTATLENTTALNNLAKAYLDSKAADDAKVSGGQSKEELDKEGKDDDTKAAKAEEKTEATKEKSDKKEATEALKSARDETREQTKIQKEMAEASKRHTKATKETHEALQETAKAAEGGAKEARQTKRQMVNTNSYNTSP